MMPPSQNLPPPPTPLSRAREKQIMPGVYFTPSPTAENLHTSAPIQRNVREMSLQDLRNERNELTKSLHMLLSSNEAMREMDPNNEDPDLVEAVGENCEIIIRRRRRLHEIETRIGEIAPAPCESDREAQPEAQPEAQDTQQGMFL